MQGGPSMQAPGPYAGCHVTDQACLQRNVWQPPKGMYNP